MSVKYFDIVEVVRIRYRCDVPDEYESVKEFADKEGLSKVFENSSHEEILDYLESDENTISEE